MITPEQVQALMRRYVEWVDAGDIEGILTMYAEDATVEDPVGQPVLRGIAAIAEFYRKGLGQAKVSALVTGPVRATHNGCGAVPFRVEMPEFSLQVIDVMEFDEAGLICSMKAFWSEVNLERR